MNNRYVHKEPRPTHGYRVPATEERFQHKKKRVLLVVFIEDEDLRTRIFILEQKKKQVFSPAGVLVLASCVPSLFSVGPIGPYIVIIMIVSYHQGATTIYYSYV